MDRFVALVFFVSLFGLNRAAGGDIEIPEFNETSIANIINKLPRDVKEFYESLSDADVDALNAAADEMAKEAESLTFDQAVAIIRKHSASLADRVEKLKKELMAKVAKMSEPVQRFINNTIAKVTGMRALPGNSTGVLEVMKMSQEIVREAFSLPDTAKVDVERNFPEIRELFQSPMVMEVAKKFAQMTPEQLKDAVAKMNEGMGDSQKGTK